MNRNSVSFVIPCLNEEKTLPQILKKIGTVRQTDLKDLNTEIVISDNGSTDRSVELALQYGARVVHCKVRGYGAALQFGIKEAAGNIIVFADADDTYDFLQAPRLIAELEKGYDLVIGSRLLGEIRPGAMPFLHRFVGTPVLNFFINTLHSKNGQRISDCNSGFRCFRRESFLSWGVTSSGMEFASEMLVKALIKEVRFSEVPISLDPHAADRIPHLKTWRDGMRHLLQIFSEAPRFFYLSGLSLLTFSWGILLSALILKKPVVIGFASVLGVHSMLMALLGSFFGLSIWGIGLFLSTKRKTTISLYRFLIDLPEDKLFWAIFFYGAISGLFLSFVIIKWAMNGFAYLALERETIALSAFISNGLLIVSQLFTAHLIKRA